jgi:hypothetical protein
MRSRALVHEPGPHRRVVPLQGHAGAGPDADLALYDLETEWTVDARSQQFSKNPWSPFDGRVRAGVMRTLVRGETVYADGEIRRAGSGRFPSRQEDHPCGDNRRRRRADVFRLALINPNTDEHHTGPWAGVGPRGAAGKGAT